MNSEVRIAGVGMTSFSKPGTGTYREFGAKAARAALSDAGLNYADIEQVYVGYVYGDSTSGQSALYDVGITGIPIINVNNNCATGSTALYLARQAVASGAADCVLALGFEQMASGPLTEHYKDRPSPLSRFTDIADPFIGAVDAPMALKLFGGAGTEYKQRYGARDETFARISVKARRHAKHNERAVFRDEVTVEQVLASPHMLGPLTRLQCCPPTCGGAAAVVVSERFAKRRALSASIRIRAQAMTTDDPSSFEKGSLINLIGAPMSAAAAALVYEAAGVSPYDLDVVELHDCFTSNEILSYESLGLCPEGGAEKFVMDCDNTYGGRVVINPSGGLLSKGHPLGATGLAQCAELVWQLRGEAGPRQVEAAQLALQHNIGIGGACVVTLYEAA